MVRCATLMLAVFFHASQPGQCTGTQEAAFVAFTQEHGRTYSHDSEEFEERRQLFEQRFEEVERWNSQPGRLWTAGINHLSDWTEDEKKSLYGYAGHGKAGEQRPRASFLQQSNVEAPLDLSDSVALPDNKIWDTSGVGLLENQGSCGSCWAVATSNLLAANHFFHTGVNRNFSAQELVDCTPNPKACGGTGGCSGATVELAVLYASLHGLATEEETPYIGSDTQCKTALVQGAGDAVEVMTMEELARPGIKQADSDHAKNINLYNWERLPINKMLPLKMALLEGTVAVSVDGSPWSNYNSGVFNSCQKDTIINHAVLAVGFGKEESTDSKFWLILNSWGNKWGDNGHIKLLRHDAENEFCGTDSKPEDGTACKGGPSEVEVCGMCGVLYDNVIARFRTPVHGGDIM